MIFLREEIISFLFCLSMIFSGCAEIKNDTPKRKMIVAKVLNENFKIIGEDKNLAYHLPDTISLSDTLKGYIVYKSDFDTIKNKPNKTYFTDFYFAKTKKLSKDYKEFQTKKLDTFARIHDSLFIIYDITFKTKGNHLLEGYIKDYLYYDEGIDSVRFKSLETHIMYNVHVK